MCKRKYFGTDGIRTKAGEFPLTPEFIQKLGYCAGKVLKTKLQKCKVVIGRDTRESGDWIFGELCKGFNKAGFNVDYVGIVATPCVSLMTQKLEYCCGVVISASHNPYYDNGIKFFSSKGEKLADEIELEIEKEIDCLQNWEYLKVDSNFNKTDGFGFYRDFCRENFKLDFHGLRIVLDCANGAFYEFAPRILREFGADVQAIFAQPNGRNINDGCGSTHIETLANYVKENQNCDISFAFDGDGDRVMIIRSDGKVLDGDFILGVLAKYLKEKNELKNNKLVLSVMANLGLKLAMKEEGIDIIETAVGDRYVYEAMTEYNAVLGGEQSGHIILKKYNTTGDGFLAGLLMVQVLKDWGKTKFFETTNKIKKYPQVLVNVKVKEKVNIENIEILKQAKDNIEADFHGKGRVLIRYSGTEPLLRIMIEAKDQTLIKTKADKFAELIKSVLG